MIHTGSPGNFDKADLTKAITAARCVLTSGITDMYKLVMAVYYALKAFNMQSYMMQGLNTAMPNLCACQSMLTSWALMFGSGASTTVAQLSSCSEAAATAQTA